MPETLEDSALQNQEIQPEEDKIQAALDEAELKLPKKKRKPKTEEEKRMEYFAKKFPSL